MEFTADSKLLSAAIARCTGVSAGLMTSLAGHVLVEAKDDEVSITGTDLIHAVSIRIPATVKTVGAMVMPAKGTAAKLRHVPGEAIVKLGKNWSATIASAEKKARKYTLGVANPETFPKVHEPSGDPFAVSAVALGALLVATKRSLCLDTSRETLQKAHVEFLGDKLRVVTTDGYRLTHTDAETNVGDRDAIDISTWAATELPRAMANDEQITIHVTSNRLHFAGDGWMISASTVGGFPPYQQIVPEPTEHQVRVDSATLQAAVSAMRAMDGCLRLTVETNVLKLEARSSDNGTAVDQVECDYDGNAAFVGLSCEYFIDALAAAPDDEVTVDICGEMDPVVIRATDYVAVVMPRRPE